MVRRFNAKTDTHRSFDCGVEDLNGFLNETDPSKNDFVPLTSGKESPGQEDTVLMYFDLMTLTKS